MNLENQTHSPDHSKWVEQLALDEIKMEQSGIIQFSNHLDPNLLLEKSCVELLEELRKKFNYLVNSFNFARAQKQDHQHIKIFKISNTANDFMLYRNGLKLIISKQDISTISIGFLSNTGQLFSARLNMNTPPEKNPHLLEVHVGPFNEIQWRFKGEAFQVDSLIKHYLTEFICHSAR